ncbi:MAG TPA: zinc ribbon domain-containing protein [Ktedonobacterales bacterium]
MFVDPRLTSQRCSHCGAIVKKDLSERWHSCSCGCELDRDHNAAINILLAGKQPTGSRACRSPALERWGTSLKQFLNLTLYFLLYSELEGFFGGAVVL